MGGVPGRPPFWRTLEESCKGLGSVTLTINTQHTLWRTRHLVQVLHTHTYTHTYTPTYTYIYTWRTWHLVQLVHTSRTEGVCVFKGLV